MEAVNKTRMEILAPAGGAEQLAAALRCGADAVYFGASGFNARRNAANFGDGEFINAVKACHLRGVKAYITLNTLVKDREMPELLKTLRLIAESGADAVIVQDFAVAAAVKRHCPDLPLHASTQMAAHNAAGARLLDEWGFKRIVLAREMSLDEIKTVCGAVNAEVEVFVHGAHCMSASGMCYMSSALGARSGNRGLCAQPCRLDFRAGDRGFALSLKDMSALDKLYELDGAGVSSFKIEGRMKRPEYVAAAVTAAVRSRNGEKPDISALKSVFSRSGFTDGYLTGRRTLDMFGTRTRDDVVSAASVLPQLAALYKDERKSVKISVKAEIKADKNSLLTVSDGENTVTVTGDIPQKAVRLELNRELCARSLLKFGGTPFDPVSFDCEPDGGIMLPAAALNALRREAAEKLSEIRENKRRVDYLEEKSAPAECAAEHSGNALRLRFEKYEQIPDNISCERLYLPLPQIIKHPEAVEKYLPALVPELPVLIYPADEKKTLAALTVLKEKGIKAALCENIGAVKLASEAGLAPLGGAMLNVLNSGAADEYFRMGVKDITLSTEMSFADMERLRFAGRLGYIACGHMPLMRFRCCPMQTAKGCAGCTGDNELTDRRGEKFRVLCSEKRYSTLFNAVPLYTGGMKRPDADFNTLFFTYETKRECAEIIKMFINGEKADFRRTAGVYDRELL